MANLVKILVCQKTLSLQQKQPTTFSVCRSEKIRWDRSDLKLGKFKFLDFLDCTDISDTTDLQFRLSERIFVYNILGPGIGYTPRTSTSTGQRRFNLHSQLKTNKIRYPPDPGTGAPFNTRGRSRLSL